MLAEDLGRLIDLFVDEDVRRGQKRDTSRGYDVVRGDVAEGLGRGLQSLAQRFESARRLVRQTVVVVVLAVVAGCGSATADEPESAGSPDASQLVAQLSDLPAGYDIVPAESFPVSTEKILREPWSTSAAGLIRRERLSGYQAAFVSPSQTRIECNAALYRSTDAARRVYSSRMKAFAAFLAKTDGRALASPGIGEESDAHRFSLGGLPYYGIAWRYRNVLSTCASRRVTRSPEADLRTAASAQQERIESVLGARR